MKRDAISLKVSFLQRLSVACKIDLAGVGSFGSPTCKIFTVLCRNEAKLWENELVVRLEVG
jgi:hypothetical protein